MREKDRLFGQLEGQIASGKTQITKKVGGCSLSIAHGLGIPIQAVYGNHIANKLSAPILIM